MPILWSLIPDIGTAERLFRLMDRRPQRFQVLNEAERFGLHAALMERHPDLPPGALDALWFDAAPPPVLEGTEPGFAPDYVWVNGLRLASARLLEALALGEGVLRTRPADASRCAPAMRDAGYAEFHVVPEADPFDRARTSAAVLAPFLPDGRVNPGWVPDSANSGPNAPVPVIRWRDDFVPPAPLFRVPGHGWLLTTDDLAERVGRAGIEDVAFQGVADDPPPHDVLLRVPGGGTRLWSGMRRRPRRR